MGPRVKDGICPSRLRYLRMTTRSINHAKMKEERVDPQPWNDNTGGIKDNGRPSPDCSSPATLLTSQVLFPTIIVGRLRRGLPRPLRATRGEEAIRAWRAWALDGFCLLIKYKLDSKLGIYYYYHYYIAARIL